MKYQNWTALKIILTHFSIIHTARMTRLFTKISFSLLLFTYYH